jgi:hypothetical protein
MHFLGTPFFLPLPATWLKTDLNASRLFFMCSAIDRSLGAEGAGRKMDSTEPSKPEGKL